MLTFLAEATPSSGGALSNGTVIIYYILAIIALVGGAVIGGERWYQKQKKKWQEEGVQRQKQQQALVENNKQLSVNSDAIQGLTKQFGELVQKFGDFTTTVQNELNGHGKRIGRLEEFAKRRDGGV